MWMPARLTVPPGRTTCNATGTSSPAGANTIGPVARAGRQLGGVTDPRRSHLARELAVPGRRGSTPPSRNPSGATPGSPGAPTRRIPSTRRARPAAPPRAVTRGTRSLPRRAAARLRDRRARRATAPRTASGTVSASAYPPSTVQPVKSACSHRFSSPRTQNSQSPSVWCNHGTPTRSPSCSDSQPSPSASIVPTAWCPGTSGRRGSSRSPSTTCRSVRQQPHAVHAHAHLAGAGLGQRRARRGASGPEPIGAGGARSSTARDYSSSSRNLASSMTSTPSCSALASLVPGLSPASTYVVFFDTLPVTLPPRARISAVASSRVKPSSVPVMTKVSPSNDSARGRRLRAGRALEVHAGGAQLLDDGLIALVGEELRDAVGDDAADALDRGELLARRRRRCGRGCRSDARACPRPPARRARSRDRRADRASGCVRDLSIASTSSCADRSPMRSSGTSCSTVSE